MLRKITEDKEYRDLMETVFNSPSLESKNECRNSLDQASGRLENSKSMIRGTTEDKEYRILIQTVLNSPGIKSEKIVLPGKEIPKLDNFKRSNEYWNTCEESMQNLFRGGPVGFKKALQKENFKNTNTFYDDCPNGQCAIDEEFIKNLARAGSFDVSTQEKENFRNSSTLCLAVETHNNYWVIKEELMQDQPRDESHYQKKKRKF